jgi:hypothetical protein
MANLTPPETLEGLIAEMHGKAVRVMKVWSWLHPKILRADVTAEDLLKWVDLLAALAQSSPPETQEKKDVTRVDPMSDSDDSPTAPAVEPDSTRGKALRKAWDAGVLIAKRYGDNVHHLTGKQADLHFESYLKGLK